MKKSIDFHFRLSENEYEKLKKHSQDAGLNYSNYLRRLINQQEIKPKPPDSYNKLAWEISKIGTSISQIAHKTNTAEYASNEDVDTAVFLLKKIIKLMREMK